MSDLNRKVAELKTVISSIRSSALSGSEEVACDTPSGYATGMCEEIIKMADEAQAICNAIIGAKGE